MSSDDSNDDGASASNDEDNPANDEDWMHISDLPQDHPIAQAFNDPQTDNSEPLNLSFEFHPHEPSYRAIDAGADTATSTDESPHLPGDTEDDLAALMKRLHHGQSTSTRA